MTKPDFELVSDFFSNKKVPLDNCLAEYFSTLGCRTFWAPQSSTFVSTSTVFPNVDLEEKLKLSWISWDLLFPKLAPSNVLLHKQMFTHWWLCLDFSFYVAEPAVYLDWLNFFPYTFCREEKHVRIKSGLASTTSLCSIHYTMAFPMRSLIRCGNPLLDHSKVFHLLPTRARFLSQ